MKEKETISGWVELRKKRGLYTFSIEEVIDAFPKFGYQYIFLSLNRQVKASRIISPARGFYVIIPTEYALTLNVPPAFYVDQMMQYLKRDYYIALLNAAEFYGAAHQRPQSFTVINTLPAMRSGTRARVKFEFISTCQPIHHRLIEKKKSKLGTVNVASAELTALDLIANEKKVGGLNRVCTVMNDLTDSFDVSKIDDDFFKIYSMPIYQRLGYILENILSEDVLANILFVKLSKTGKRLRPIPFKIGKPIEGCEANNRWKVIENQEIEIDE